MLLHFHSHTVVHADTARHGFPGSSFWRRQTFQLPEPYRYLLEAHPGTDESIGCDDLSWTGEMVEVILPDVVTRTVLSVSSSVA